MSSPVWRILIMDDAPASRRTLQEFLSISGHHVEEACSIADALQRLSTSSFEFVLLSLNSSSADEITSCKMVRSISPSGGLVVFSKYEAENDRVVMLDAGADFCLTKPIRLRELIAYLNAIYRRTRSRREKEAEILTAGAIQMDLRGHSVQRAGEVLHLNPKEFDLLAVLMKHSGHPVAGVTLLRSVWGSDYGNESAYLRSYIKMLRKKIEADPARPEYILTEPRIGYRFGNPVIADALSPQN